ncbi:MAG: DoxX family protein [Candidatus Eiseniibacteriota bacterium]
MKRIPWGNLALWVVSAFLVYVFVPQGLAKFSDSSGWARAFAGWHYPVWFRILIGIIETGAALLLLTRRTASIGAAMIAVVMLGGMGTHLYWGQARYMTSEVVPLTASLVVLVGRWRHFTKWALRPRDPEAP